VLCLHWSYIQVFFEKVEWELVEREKQNSKC
jgi:hypothetical protein